MIDRVTLRPHPPTVLVIDSKPWFAFDAAGYRNLAENHQDYLRAIRQQRAVIEYYRECLPR